MQICVYTTGEKVDVIIIKNLVGNPRVGRSPRSIFKGRIMAVGDRIEYGCVQDASLLI
jgi:hypothetical protein